jgi:hypothetical protein
VFSGTSGPSTKGEILLGLPGAPVDLTGKTITVHVASDPGCSDLNLSLVLNTQAGPIYFTPTFSINPVTNSWNMGTATVPGTTGSTSALALSLQAYSSTNYQGTIYLDEIGIAPGGAAGNGGAGGTAGAAGTGGRGGTSGTTGSGGTTGTGGTSPCAGMCAKPLTVPANSNSGDLGTGATCNQVLGNAGSFVCGDFVTPRTFTVNNTNFDCEAGSGGTLPAPQNGGWCMQASAGNNSYAYFATYNVR